MIYKISITLKNSGKVIEILVDKTEEAVIFALNQEMSDTEWLIMKGFDAHPLKVKKEIGIRWKEIGGIEMTEAEDWLVESANDFNESLKSENKQ